MRFNSMRQRTTVRLPLHRSSATSVRHTSARAKDRYSGNARDRRYEGTKAEAISEGEKIGSFAGVNAGCTPAKYGGGSRAENAGVRVLIVQALSVLGSCCVNRAS